MPRDLSLRTLAPISLLTVFAFLIMGYHPGLEDDVFYLSAIKRNLNPALFPHDADFFRIQFQATIFDKLIAASIRLTHLPVAWAVLLWQLAAIFFILHACLRIARRCFPTPAAHWAAVTLVAALLTIPVSGTAINLVDQYLHPRALATAAILAAIVAVLDSREKPRRHIVAAIWLAVAVSIHAIMAAFGISFCAFLWWTLRKKNNRPLKLTSSVLALCPLWSKNLFLKATALKPRLPHPYRALCDRVGISAVAIATLSPIDFLFEPTNQAWRKAASTRNFNYLARYEWYEWLGVFAPLVLLFAYQQFLVRGSWVAQRFQRCDNSAQGTGALAPEGQQLYALVSALLYYGIFQTLAALVIMLPPSLERLRPLEPMRYLHILYLLFFLLVGALLGQHILSSRKGRHPERSRISGEMRDLPNDEPLGRTRIVPYRWALLFLPLAAGMFYAQRQLYPASTHIEWPNATPRNSWLQSFDWIKQNTLTDALFALGPRYMEQPGEDFHGFRALAERSSLADYNKDGGMAARVPALASRWLKEVDAQNGWKNFQAQDFARLKNDFGVTWIILSKADKFGLPNPIPSDAGITCPYQNEQIRVCRLY